MKESKKKFIDHLHNSVKYIWHSFIINTFQQMTDISTEDSVKSSVLNISSYVGPGG